MLDSSSPLASSALAGITTLRPGKCANTASRLCSNAPAGTVLIAGGTWDLLTDKPAGERLEPLKVKGREAPVEVYSVGDRVASPA